MTNSVRTRFAPSPTGYLHIGGIRTALFSWLYARHHGGQFILRIEDTDRERSTEAATNLILEGMQWLGLDYDEGPYYQTQRFDRYKQIIQQLIDGGKAYYCYCSKEELEEMRNTAMVRGEKPKYNGRCRDRVDVPADGINPVIRFRNPQQGEVVVDDLIQGLVTYQNSELDDLIIARSDGTPTYNLTVVVDDLDMRITHVIRGDDHLNNTPRQINIFAALGENTPRYGHVPMILGSDRKKISKRDTTTVSVLHYRDEGILPEALLNYIVRLGWSYGDQEIFSREELIELFDISNVNKAAAALNQDKLLWLNQYYLKNVDAGYLSDLFEQALIAAGLDITQGPAVRDLTQVQRERCQTLTEMVEQSRMFYIDFDEYDAKAANKHLRPDILEPLTVLRDNLTSLSEWTSESIHKVINDTATSFELNMGKLAQPLRVAVTGTPVSPSIDETVRLIGKVRTLARLDRTLDFIRRRQGSA